MGQKITFNEQLKLILADVDETIADVYMPTDPQLVSELEKLLTEDRVIFLVSGGGLKSIQERVSDFIAPHLRHRIIIAHCSGAEVWGFQKRGELNSKPFYGLYEGSFTSEQKQQWREISQKLIDRFQLKTFPTQPRAEFIKNSNGDPLSIMLADRGPQITYEFVNSINLSEEQRDKIQNQLDIDIPETHGTYDLRVPVLEMAKQLYQESKLPVSPHLAGVFALDHIIDGVSKTHAIKTIFKEKEIFSDRGINIESLNSTEIEIWGDKFSQKKGGPDFQMCLAVDMDVRAIDFRKENADELPEGYNIQLWNGEKELHNGLLEYLQGRG